MHIALVSPSWPIGSPNGIVTYVHHLRSGLLSLDHRVSVLAFSGVDGPSMENVHAIEGNWISRVNRIKGRLFGEPSSPSSWVARSIADTVLRIHRRSPIDVVEMEESFGWFDEVREILPMPVVVKLHGPSFLVLSEENRSTAAGTKKIHTEREALLSAPYVTSPSLSTLIRTRHHCELSPGWGRVIPNPVFIDDELPVWLRQTADPNLLLFVGRFDKVKGGDFLIRAFGQLLSQRPKLRLIFVGPDVGLETPVGRRVQFGEFIRDVLPLAAHSQVEMKGLLGQEDIIRLRCESSMTLICSPWENQPNTAIEAMIQGCPLVGIDSGGLSEMIKHGVSGLLARPGDQDDFCRQVLRLLDRPDEAESFGAAARCYARQHYDATAVASQTVAYYREVLALHGSKDSTAK